MMCPPGWILLLRSLVAGTGGGGPHASGGDPIYSITKQPPRYRISVDGVVVSQAKVGLVWFAARPSECATVKGAAHSFSPPGLFQTRE
jgi:hypothetical protein